MDSDDVLRNCVCLDNDVGCWRSCGVRADAFVAFVLIGGHSAVDSAFPAALAICGKVNNNPTSPEAEVGAPVLGFSEFAILSSDESL